MGLRKISSLGRSRHRISALFLTSFLWAGCITAQVQVARKMNTVVESHHAVLILDLTESPLEIEAEECITESVRAAIPGVRMMTRDDFRRMVFYYGYPESEEESIKYFTMLALHPVMKERIAELGLRYAISIYGGTEQHGEPIIGGFGGYGGAVTWFGGHWTRKSRLEASIFDFRKVTDAGTIRSLAEGDPWFICIGIGPLCAPIGAAAFTESTACSGLGKAVATFLTGGNLSESASSTDQAPE